MLKMDVGTVIMEWDKFYSGCSGVADGQFQFHYNCNHLFTNSLRLL